MLYSFEQITALALYNENSADKQFSPTSTPATLLGVPLRQMKYLKDLRKLNIGLSTLLLLLLSSQIGADSAQAAPKNALNQLKLPDFVPPQQFGFVSGNIDDPAIGRQLFRRLRQQRRLIEDPELTGWIQKLTHRLARTTPGIANHLHIAIENNPEINAHVLRGGIILVNSGLILNSESESELAAVLAHEIAHISQRHLSRMAAANKNSPWLTGLGLLAGAAVASKNPQAGQAIMTGTSALRAQHQISYSQRYETEADRTGMRILSAAGFDPTAMPYFLEKLERSESNLYGNISKYLRSHPLTIERLSDTRHQAKQAGKRQVRDSLDYLYAREKLRILTAKHQTAAHHTLPGNIQNYRQAFIAQQAGQAQRTLQLIGQNTKHSAVVLLKAQALNTLRRYTETEQLVRPWLKRLPRHEGLTLALAQALLGNSQNAQALQLLRRIPSSDKTSLEFIEVGQYIARQAGQPQQSILYNAERRLRTADYRNAELSLQQALRTPNTTPAIKTQLQQKLRSVQQAKQEFDYIRKR